MYCAVTPALGLVPVNEAEHSHPNFTGIHTTHSTPYYMGQPCTSMSMEEAYHQNALNVTYEHYRSYLHYQVMASTVSDSRYWTPAYANACYRQMHAVGQDNISNGIPLKTFMDERNTANKVPALALRDQFQHNLPVDGVSSLSPPGFLYSNESSGYASSSGRSSESPCEGITLEPTLVNLKQCEDGYNSVDKIAVRPRIRPAKPSRKAISRTRECEKRPKAQDIKTPECGLISQRQFPNNRLSSFKGYVHPNNANMRNSNAMEVDDTVQKHAVHISEAACQYRQEQISILNKKNAMLPIKERIKKFEKMCNTFSKQPKSAIQYNRNGSEGNILDKSTSAIRHSNKPEKRNENHTNSDPKIEKAKEELGNSKKMFLGMYEVQAVLGVGGGGTVYSGVRIADARPIAIKRIMREKIKRWEKVQGRKVPQEIVLMLKVNGHKNVIRLLDWYECLDSFILILERPKNCVDLFDYIREVERIDEEEGAFIFRQVVEAVKHIQSRGVLHRDIKDENVVINRETKKPKIIDFGCGTNLHEGVYTDFSGTPEFYPPEWFSKREYKGRTATTWSLGILLYDMLCGEIPFKTKNKIVANILTFKTSLSPKAKHLIMWMLCSEPEARPTMDEILQHPWIQSRT